MLNSLSWTTGTLSTWIPIYQTRKYIASLNCSIRLLIPDKQRICMQAPAYRWKLHCTSWYQTTFFVRGKSASTQLNCKTCHDRIKSTVGILASINHAFVRNLGLRKSDYSSTFSNLLALRSTIAAVLVWTVIFGVVKARVVCCTYSYVGVVPICTPYCIAYRLLLQSTAA